MFPFFVSSFIYFITSFQCTGLPTLWLNLLNIVLFLMLL